ncbi:molybdopterin-guanine dinucleotide biosynthesis protein B [Oceanobacillus chungangensis]|nr:molybdopterin-guanine dinucleotide biosynthesis protein B [Oceanobacillus chungangensis]
MEVIQIIGYKNSGKTTTASKLIEVLSQQGIQVASLKHHGHGGKPLGIENTDSFKHHKAGAIVSGVEGEGMFQLTNHHSWNLEQMLAIYEILNIDVLVIEGFKQSKYKKVVLINKEEDLILLEEATNIVAVITSLPLESSFYPIFKRTHLRRFCDWMYQTYIAKGID